MTSTNANLPIQWGGRSRPPRLAYVASWPPETFIVPLLKARIEEFLSAEGKPRCAGDRVLDVGCGRQPFRHHLEAIGYAYSSLDAVQNAEGTVEFVTPLDAELPGSLLRAPPFHLVLCTEVLEHVADWATAFRNLALLVAPGGFIFITCPHFYPLHETPFDFWRPTRFAIEYHARKVGLNVERAEQAGNQWEVLGTLLAEAGVYARSTHLPQRALAWFARKLFHLGFRLISGGWPQRHLELRSLFYLSNIAILRRPVSQPQ